MLATKIKISYSLKKCRLRISERKDEVNVVKVFGNKEK